MRAGKISETVWRRTVKKQLQLQGQQPLLYPGLQSVGRHAKLSDEGDVYSEVAYASGEAHGIGCFPIARVCNELWQVGATQIRIAVQVFLPMHVSEGHLKCMIREMALFCTEHEISIEDVQAQFLPTVQLPLVMVQGYASGKQISANHTNPQGLDLVYCGYVGLEGMLRILEEDEAALKTRFSTSFFRKIQEKKRYLCQRKALQIARESDVFAMHQVTEGGIFAALWEVAEEFEVGLDVELPKMSILQETVEICECYQLNPYQMTSSGSFLFVTEQGDVLVRKLKEAGVPASKIGSFTSGCARVIRTGEEVRYLDKPVSDEWTNWLSVQYKEQGELGFVMETKEASNPRRNKGGIIRDGEVEKCDSAISRDE
jgi:hydrogenase maturation factor